MRVVVLACLALLLMLLLAPRAASAAGTVSLTSTSYTVNEGAGNAVITFTRSTASTRGEVRYGAWHRTAQQFQDYKPVKGRVDLAPGQTEGSFSVPIVDDPLVEGRETIAVGIFGTYPERVGRPDRAILTIEDNDAISTDPRDSVNPLGLNPAPTDGNPLSGARFYDNPSQTIAGVYANRIKRSKPGAARMLSAISSQPESKRFGSWNDRPGYVVAKYLAQAYNDDPGAIPLLATYRLKHLTCHRVSDSAREAAAYKRWYSDFANGIGNQRVVLFYEIDALITAPCLSGRGLQVRIDEMRSAIDSLARLPHAVVYVDAGASDAHHPRFIGSLLRKVGVNKIQGFFTNSTHHNRTTKEIRYADGLSRATGGKHYVVNTAVNGKGALRPKNKVEFGNSIRCNPRGRGLGPKPTSNVPPQYPRLDGLFWIGNPGRSAGNCGTSRNAPPTGTFWLDYALMLIKNADYRIR
ncbi:glycoside hydrolase family 6 protein [Conexibacter sp. CPCC 206217]|uniref:glycoside hydrolase family 6 protein n=1 Tax=Conexibacter sp. CPCC 206217 TaxID=3064574 RepID=UPI00271D4728|nr:glycoside hydrolase family 6 protein [Conexibacter sp. CPCC 206217]MDO8210809.1 glycoside hydrolase family 6 protein [Conexibacter sp. CPCC 206217]